jgi:cold shock protein
LLCSKGDRLPLSPVDFTGEAGVTDTMEDASPPKRQNGKVKFFDKDRGFGFVTPDDGGRDVFVHVSSVQRSGMPHLDDGMKLSYATEDDARGRGPQAINLQLL